MLQFRNSIFYKKLNMLPHILPKMIKYLLNIWPQKNQYFSDPYLLGTLEYFIKLALKSENKTFLLNLIHQNIGIVSEWLTK